MDGNFGNARWNWNLAKYAIDNLLKGKEIIIPGISIKFVYYFTKFVSRNFSSELAYNTQKAKNK